MIRACLAFASLLLTAPAWATSSFQDLTVGGTVTVQGSAFSVGGATFSVAGGSITLGGRLNAAVTGIRWADGTTSTTAFAGATAASVRLATFTILRVDVQETVDNPRCISGSTIAATLSACRVNARVTGATRGSDGGNEQYLAVLQNGAMLNGWGQEKPMTYGRAIGGATDIYNNVSINYTTRISTVAGTHSFCLAMWTNASGTAILEGAEANANFEIHEVCDQ